MKGAEEATWDRLAEALDSVELEEMAEKVREEHCKKEETPTTSPTSKLVRRRHLTFSLGQRAVISSLVSRLSQNGGEPGMFRVERT